MSDFFNATSVGINMDNQQQQHIHNYSPQDQTKPVSSIAALLEAAKYLEYQEFEAEHGYATRSNKQEESQVSSVSPKSLKKPIKSRAGVKMSHNELEKNRRAFLREAMNELRGLVPWTSYDNNMKHTTLGVLRKTREFISALQDKEKNNASHKERLLRDQRLLQRRLLNLQMKMSNAANRTNAQQHNVVTTQQQAQNQIQTQPHPQLVTVVPAAVVQPTPTGHLVGPHHPRRLTTTTPISISSILLENVSVNGSRQLITLPVTITGRTPIPTISTIQHHQPPTTLLIPSVVHSQVPRVVVSGGVQNGTQGGTTNFLAYRQSSPTSRPGYSSRSSNSECSSTSSECSSSSDLHEFESAGVSPTSDVSLPLSHVGNVGLEAAANACSRMQLFS